MEVRLKVMVGANAGKELPVTGPQFLVGRAEDCQLRPHSDLISRHHCVLLIEDGLLIVRDFGSKNGTRVNDERVAGERELKSGDRLVIGPLDFEVSIRTGVAAKKRPKVEGVKEAAARTAEGSSSELPQMDQWLAPGADQAKNETRRLNFNETDEIELTQETQVGPLPIPAPPASQPVPSPHASMDKKAPGKLPAKDADSKDSGHAASLVLNKFFKRR